ncbi:MULTISPECIES: ATP-binding cassette domain-containing protein [Vagococcus]|uniref:UvrABC system protein A n=1 Tax=Vagococcus fluvialis bH819 TaxID=1255619 RepID=A0A1X6WQN4_9ENTE|nr:MULTISPECIES: ATP-binding cassette domain-containing protein [Vagococcus]SLM86651.1 Excinuclease ABC subunit A paralog of unknown function [Vagococcus fluvialis bH819]HCM90859.1 daunorubicin resistance protein DrrC [Vagococcus sp.]
MTDKYIEIKGAREGNLKDINLKIKKNQVTAFVGVSGSGKTSLVHRTIGAEAQNQMNDTYPSFIKNRLPKMRTPNVDSISNLSPPIIVNQKGLGDNERSTVGTVTDINASLRLLFSRFGIPFVGYSDIFSFNSPNGMCLACDGLGKKLTFVLEELLDQEKSLNDGAIQFKTFEPGSYRWHRYVDSGFFDNDKKIKDFSVEEIKRLLYSEPIKPPNPNRNWYMSSQYEGVIPRIIKTFIKNPSKTYKKYDVEIQRVTKENICPTCQGHRLNEKALSSKINGKHIAEWQQLELSELLLVLRKIKNQENELVVDTVMKPIESLCQVGLGYLSLSRTTNTLSGGESQRVKLIKYLGSNLSDLLYIMDEPSTGLHPHDLSSIRLLINQISQKDNTILMIDHDQEMICEADEIIELGPKSGYQGGQVMYQGSFDIWRNEQEKRNQFHREKVVMSEDQKFFKLKNITFRNLEKVSGKIPHNCLTAITGVAGSGKSSFVKILRKKYSEEVILVDQKEIKGSYRSTVASYIGIYDRIRELFAKENKIKSGFFSFNGLGACPNCKGKGFVETEMAFLESVKISCEACNGLKFKPDVLNYLYLGKNIVEVLNLRLSDALEFFKDEKILNRIKWLVKIGIGYLTLGQTLDTLSGGERQRVKLSLSLDEKQKCFVLDEPTTGLSNQDLSKLMSVIDELIKKGNTVVIIEHNMLLVRQCDWLIDFGPGSGRYGGRILYEGRPEEIKKSADSITKDYLY